MQCRRLNVSRSERQQRQDISVPLLLELLDPFDWAISSQLSVDRRDLFRSPLVVSSSVASHLFRHRTKAMNEALEAVGRV